FRRVLFRSERCRADADDGGIDSTSDGDERRLVVLQRRPLLRRRSRSPVLIRPVHARRSAPGLSGLSREGRGPGEDLGGGRERRTGGAVRKTLIKFKAQGSRLIPC